MMALWNLAHVQLGQDERKNPVYDFDTLRLRQYWDAQHSLLEGETYEDVLDAMAACRSAWNSVA